MITRIEALNSEGNSDGCIVGNRRSTEKSRLHSGQLEEQVKRAGCLADAMWASEAKKRQLKEH